ncbi:amidase [Lichenibacterium ramalinae]|uniref:Amidase n=1 Tax=Lichenibacterium ramalinae TaxID=2316527 RepID=A0A4Q2RHH0_9HYPH|nr:amidase [Lichenibacterium ramalinae]RYB06559.1 amidase [Lichenibacterium ramalinae]
MESHALGLSEAVLALRSGALDAAAYRAALLTRARRIDPALRAFTVLAGDAPGKDAMSVLNAPLAGVPVAVKDIVATRDFPTANGSPVYADRVPDADAWVVERLKALGGSVLGKTVTTEFAWRQPGPTGNPWDLAHTPGGSSSGSAAAVAAGLAPLAFGTQTFGSIVRPAAYCGVVGLKPSFGAVPRVGVHPLAGSLDHVGFFTRSVGDAAYALSLFAEVDARDRHGLPPPPFAIDPAAGLLPLDRPPRIALVRTPLWSGADADARALVEDSARAFAAAGAAVEDYALPVDIEGLAREARTILAVEASAIFAALVALHPDRTSAHLKDLVAEGAGLPAPAYAAALRRQAELRDGFDAALGPHDVVLTLPAPGAAPRGLAFTGDPGFCVPWTCLGVPALALPAGQTVGGLPLGLQLVGRYRGDLSLLRVAAWCEAVLGRPRCFPSP